MIKHRDQWEWIKETLSKMELTKEGYGLTMPDGVKTSFDMGMWGVMTDGEFEGCAIGHLAMFHPEQTLVEDIEDAIYTSVPDIALYFGITGFSAAYAFIPHDGEECDPQTIIDRMTFVEEVYSD